MTQRIFSSVIVFTIGTLFSFTVHSFYVPLQIVQMHSCESTNITNKFWQKVGIHGLPIHIKNFNYTNLKKLSPYWSEFEKNQVGWIWFLCWYRWLSSVRFKYKLGYRPCDLLKIWVLLVNFFLKKKIFTRFALQSM